MEPVDQLNEDTKLVEALLLIEEGLTEWEVNFIESVYSQLKKYNRPLSHKQRETCERIANRLDV